MFVGMMTLVLGVIAALCCLQAVPPLKFDAATIKPAQQRPPAFGCRGTDGPDNPSVGLGRCHGNGSLRSLLTEAFDLPKLNSSILLLSGMVMRVSGPSEKYRIAGAPSWIDSDRYSVEATAGFAATREQLHEMLQTFLRDRFKLSFHHESRPVDGFVLTVGKGGPTLERATGEEADSGIHWKMVDGEIMHQKLVGTNVPISALIDVLTPGNGPIVDRTGLTGNYNFVLPKFRNQNAINVDAPTILTVIQDLGLRLESGKVPVEVIVIDHIEKPEFGL
jgi:uncharacterized protein (TIGR03435 family)